MQGYHYNILPLILMMGQIMQAEPSTKTVKYATPDATATKPSQSAIALTQPTQQKVKAPTPAIKQAAPAQSTPITPSVTLGKTTMQADLIKPIYPAVADISAQTTQKTIVAQPTLPTTKPSQSQAPSNDTRTHDKFSPTIKVLEAAVSEYNAATKIFKSKANDIKVIRKCILDLVNLGMPINEPFVKRWDDGMVTPFDWAIVNGKSDFAIELLNLGASSSMPNKKEMTPLMFLYRPFGGSKSLDINTRLKIADELLRRGANTNVNYAEPIFGNTALIYVVEAPCGPGTNEADVALLLKAGAKTNYENKRGVSALDTAAFVADARVIELLIKNGALVNTQGERNAQSSDQEDRLITTLMYVALGAQFDSNPQKMEKQKNTFRILLCNGADITLKDHNNNDINAYVAQVPFLQQELEAFKADKDGYCAQYQSQLS